MPESIEGKLKSVRSETAAREAEEKKAAELSAKREKFESLSQRREPLVKERDGLKELLQALKGRYESTQSSLEAYKENKARIHSILEQYRDELHRFGVTDLKSLLEAEDFRGDVEAVGFRESKKRLKQNVKSLGATKERVKTLIPESDFRGGKEEESEEESTTPRQETIGKLEEKVSNLDQEISSLDQEWVALKQELTELCGKELKTEDLKFRKPETPNDFQRVSSYMPERIAPQSLVQKYGRAAAEETVRRKYEEYLDALPEQFERAHHQHHYGTVGYLSTMKNMYGPDWQRPAKEAGMAIFDLKLAKERGKDFYEEHNIKEMVERKEDSWRAGEVLRNISRFRSLNQEMQVEVNLNQEQRFGEGPRVRISNLVWPSTERFDNLQRQLGEATQSANERLRQAKEAEEQRPRVFGKKAHEEKFRSLYDVYYETRQRKEDLEKLVEAERRKNSLPDRVENSEMSNAFSFFGKAIYQLEGVHKLGEFLDNLEAFCKSVTPPTPEEEEQITAYNQLREEYNRSVDKASSRGIRGETKLKRTNFLSGE